MGFKLDDLIIDSIDMAIATDFDDVPLYVLTQLSEATIDITAESEDAVDKKGTLIKKFWKSKAGTFTATNAMLNLNILGAMSGEGKFEAGEGAAAIVMPKILTVKAGSTVTLANYNKTKCKVTLAGIGNNGAMDTATKYTQGTSATATTFAVSDAGVLTPPTVAEGSNVTKFVVLYKRPVENGVMIQNRADKFPGTVRLYIKALAVDPCSADTLRAVIIYLPSFQVSPEVSISLSTDGTIDYSGDLQVD